MDWTVTTYSDSIPVGLEARCSTVPGLPEELRWDSFRATLKAEDAALKRWSLGFSITVEADGKPICIGSQDPILLRGVRSSEDAIIRAEKALYKYLQKLERFTSFVQTQTDREHTAAAR